jgi:hypothetical protein
MANWTAANLANAVLIRLGVLASGQTAEPEDSNIVTDAWESIYPYLQRHQLVPFTAGAIEEEYQEPLSKYVASKIYGNWGITGAREATILRDGNNGWIELQEVALDHTTTRRKGIEDV